MKHKRFERIGEDLYSGQLKNGLTINVVTKPGFQLSYAVFATNYGGAHRRFSLGGEMHNTPAGVAHFLEHKLFEQEMSKESKHSEESVENCLWEETHEHIEEWYEEVKKKIDKY